MSFVFPALLFFLAIICVLKKAHNVLFYLCVISLFADGIRFDYGIRVSLVQLIGFLVFPLILRNRVFVSRDLYLRISPLYFEFLYLCVLGVVFGLIFPWEDLTGTRMWSQTSGGRSIVSLIRLANDFFILFYFYWLFKTGRVALRMFVYCVASVTVVSFWVGIIDANIGYGIVKTLVGGHENVFNTGRIVGLNGEPKALGRNAALAFGILLIYLQNHRGNILLYFSLISNIFAVLASLSATSMVIFGFMLMFLYFYNFKIKYIFYASFVVALFVFVLAGSDFFTEVTFPKIVRAFTGEDATWWARPLVPGEPAFFSRFDIFDRLALVFLWEHPLYMLFGTGPNLISIPASVYVPEQTGFYELGRIDSVPNFMITNVLSRSGFLGLIMYSAAAFKIYNYLKGRGRGVPLSLVAAGFVYSFVYFDSMMFSILGVALGLAYLDGKSGVREKGNRQGGLV